MDILTPAPICLGTHLSGHVVYCCWTYHPLISVDIPIPNTATHLAHYVKAWNWIHLGGHPRSATQLSYYRGSCCSWINSSLWTSQYAQHLCHCIGVCCCTQPNSGQSYQIKFYFKSVIGGKIKLAMNMVNCLCNYFAIWLPVYKCWKHVDWIRDPYQ